MMLPSVAELSELMDQYESTAERPRYTKAQRPGRPKKDNPWRIEGIYVAHEVWRQFADEKCRSYYGGHGSRRIWVVSFNGEELGKFPTQMRAQEFIWSKERS